MDTLQTTLVAGSLMFIAGLSGAFGKPTTAPMPASKETFTVIACNDGDTCRLQAHNEVIKLRLVGIDAPETRGMGKKKVGQPLALDAKAFLNSRVQGKEVTLRQYGKDLYGRLLGEIVIDGKSANLELIQEGYAEVYRGKPPTGFDIEPFISAEEKAQKQKKGIWGIEGYESPKQFRKRR
jgi:endonuclease YncB( thermonuclease family)